MGELVEVEDVLVEAFESRSDVEVITNAERVEDAFLIVYGRYQSKFGVPDFPGDDHLDWRQELGLDCALLAVWDFDDHQLTIRVEGDRVLVRRFRPSERGSKGSVETAERG